MADIDTSQDIQIQDDETGNDENESNQQLSKESEFTPEVIEEIFKDEDYDDLENTPYNSDWLNNKKVIDSTYRNTGISTGLSNYGKNLILFYEKKIKVVNELMKRKKSDNKKNFIGDITIQEDQKLNIEKMILDDSKVKKVDPNDLKKMIESYYTKIGNKSGEIMQKDYDDRNRTIKYLLLIKEYEENIEKIRDAIKDYSGTDNDFLKKLDEIYGELAGGKNQKGGIKDMELENSDLIRKIGSIKPLLDYYSEAVKIYTYIGEKTITNSILATQLIYLFFQIQNAFFNPFIVNKGYFQIDELEETVMKLKIQNNNLNLVGGGNNLDNFLSNITNEDYEPLTNEEDFEDDKINQEIENESLNDAEESKKKIDQLLSLPDLNPDFITPLSKFKEKTEARIALLQSQASSAPEVSNESEASSAPEVSNESEASTISQSKFKVGDNIEFDYENQHYKGNIIEMDSDKAKIKTTDDSEGELPLDYLAQNAKIISEPSSTEESTPISEKQPELPTPSSNSAINEAIQNTQKAFKSSIEFNDQATKHFLENFNSLAEDIKKLETELDEVNNSKLTLKEKLDKINQTAEQTIQNITQSASKCISTITTLTKEYENLVNNTENTLKNIADEIQRKKDDITNLIEANNKIDKENIASFIEESENEKKTEDLLDKISDLDQPIKNNLGFGNKISKKTMFINKFVRTNYVKNNLYEFLQQCKNLDSVPEWRALISKLIVSYITSYVEDPNSKNEHVNVIPSYDYFNLVLMGTPGVGKSYTSAIVGLALKWSGFLTLGDLKEIKKPDIIGAYTGQTAPKVYNELTQALGKVVFIDEAYSIAGPQDKVKKTFNEYGQEALDAITDYTSEHIGLFAFIVAGYEYEMKHQFLDVNIGLPRRFPTVLTLRRYDMKSFWKILQRPLLTFCPKFQVNHHHHACFELLNLMFNYQCSPNPKIRLSKDWKKMWEGYKLFNLKLNLHLSMDRSDINKFEKIPILKLTNLNQKLEDIENTPIMGETVEVLPYSKFFNKKNDLTTTFIKAFFIYKFTQILNGDFFRSQADNLTKFSQTILEDEIINPSGLFQASQNKNETGNIPWIEYLYFKLYFTRNPNRKVFNIEYEYVDPVASGGTKKNKKKNFTKKLNKKKKFTKKLYKKNKNKKTKKQRKGNKNHKKTNKQKGGSPEDIEKIKTYLNYVNKEIYLQKKKSRIVNSQKTQKPDEDEFKAASDSITKMNISELDETLSLLDAAIIKTQEIISNNSQINDTKTNNIINNLETFIERINTLKSECNNKITQLQSEKSISADIIENVPENSEISVPSVDNSVKEEDVTVESEATANLIEQLQRENEGMGLADKESIINEQMNKTVDMRKKLKEELEDVLNKNLPQIQKDLEFNVTGIDFAYLRDIPDLVENIIRHKSQENEENKKNSENDKLLPLFKNYLQDYGNYLNIYENNNDFKIDDKFISFVYVYLLLSGYYTAAVESVKEVGKFDKESWWFFTPTDFTDIKNDLDFEIILQNYDNLTIKSSPNDDKIDSISESSSNEPVESQKEDDENESFKYFG